MVEYHPSRLPRQPVTQFAKLLAVTFAEAFVMVEA